MSDCGLGAAEISDSWDWISPSPVWPIICELLSFWLFPEKCSFALWKNNKQNIEEARKNYILINKWNFGIKAIYRAETGRAAVFFPTILVFVLDFKPEKKIIPCRSSFRFPRKMKDEERICPHLALSLFLKDAQIKCEVS